jgi:hypothetical protein
MPRKAARSRGCTGSLLGFPACKTSGHLRRTTSRTVKRKVSKMTNQHPASHPIKSRPSPRQLLLSLVLGTLLAAVCAYAGSLLTPLAMARWTIQFNEHEEVRATLALLGVRHLPMFLLAVALGNVIFRIIKSPSLWTLATVTGPYVLYVIGQGVLDSLAAGESAFSWVTYEPAYFIWPHFVAVPVGLYAAGRMVDRKRPIPIGH